MLLCYYSIILKNGRRILLGKWFKPTEEEIKDIIDSYKKGLGTGPLRRKYSCSEKTIKRILDENNVERHARGGIQQYFFNENFLDELDSSEKLYLLGWLYSDGNVSKTEKLIRIGLAMKDREILEILNKILENDRPLREDVEHGKPKITLSLCSKHFKERLIELGCIPEKSLVLTYPNWIPERYLKDFVRGYFDGDGSLTIKQNKGGAQNGVITIASTFDFASKLQEKKKKKVGIKGKVKPLKEGSLCYGYFINRQEDVLKFLDWIYSDINCIKLSRKWKLYKELKLNRQNLKFDKAVQQQKIKKRRDEILKLYKEGNLSAKQLSEKFGVHITTIYRIINKSKLQEEF